MLVVLSAGLLTALSATAMSQAQPAFADKKKCEDNGSDNCNDQNQNMKQKNDCKIENENKDHSDGNSNENEQTCLSLGANPGNDLNNENNGDQVFGLTD
jgi:hypothetical protein